MVGYLLRKLKSSKIIDNGIIVLRNNIEVFVKEQINKYLMLGESYTSVVMIFAGFDIKHKKKINSTTLGNFYSKTLIGKEKGIVPQRLNRKVIEGLLKESSKRGTKGKKFGEIGEVLKDTEFEVDLPYSSVFVIEIVLPDEPKVKDIDCYKFVMRAPQGLSENKITDDFLQKIEIDVLDSSQSGESILRQWTLHVIELVKSVERGYFLQKVGGDVVVMMLTPKGAVFPAGRVDQVDFETRKIDKVSEFLVKDGKFCTRDLDGHIIPYEYVVNFNKRGKSEL